MPNHRTHIRTGIAVGGLTALARAAAQPDMCCLVEALGGLAGGAIGGIAPDVLEPAISPNHRKLAHSVATAGAISLAKVAEWQDMCRRRGATATQTALSCAAGTRERADAEFAAFGWSFLAGFIAGFFAGYASHLALDAVTARGLPLWGLG
ncbi:MAG: metal-dependent hydrolase [Gemmatimonadota bacterium]|nr:metal-dependent hydrolase [Gemmatimonadota bacterium]